MAGHVGRTDWKALHPRSKELLNGPVNRVVIHHTAMRNCKSPAEGIKEIQAIQRVHMQERGFDDIGYNFLIGQDGTMYEGRGWGVMGAHTKNYNNSSLGIAFMGNFNYDSPSSEALESVKQLLRDGVSEGFLLPDFVLSGHKDLGRTECPGATLYAALSQLKAS